MIFRILLIPLILSSCAYHRAYKDRECNHNHFCCDVGCACCGKKVGDLGGGEPLDLSKINRISSESVDFKENLPSEPVNTTHFKFTGSEPFWSLEIKGDSLFIEMLAMNSSYAGPVQLSEKSQNGETYGFKSGNVYGVINKTWSGECSYAVTDEDPLDYAIYFVFDTTAYRGCGTKVSLLENGFLHSYWRKGVVLEADGRVQFDLRFDLHGFDCGAPDCFQTDIAFDFNLGDSLQFPSSLPFQLHEHGCKEERGFEAVFTLQSEDENCVIYHCPERNAVLVLFSKIEENEDFFYFFEGVETNKITNETFSKFLKVSMKDETKQPYMSTSMRSYE